MEKKSFFWDLKPPKSCDLITELVSKLVLTQWNMVISCSSAFYPQTFCLTGIFFPPASRKPRAYPQIFCQLPIQLLFVPGSWEPDRGLDIDTSCSAQSSGTCPDQAPGEVEEEMPSPASQLVLRWFNPLAIWSLLPAMHTAWSGKWKLSAGFSIFFFLHIFANQDAWRE